MSLGREEVEDVPEEGFGAAGLMLGGKEGKGKEEKVPLELGERYWLDEAYEVEELRDDMVQDEGVG